MSAHINRTLPHIKMSAVHFGRCMLFAPTAVKPPAETAKHTAATCPRQARRGRQVAANLKDLGYGL